MPLYPPPPRKLRFKLSWAFLALFTIGCPLYLMISLPIDRLTGHGDAVVLAERGRSAIFTITSNTHVRGGRKLNYDFVAPAPRTGVFSHFQGEKQFGYADAARVSQGSDSLVLYDPENPNISAIGADREAIEAQWAYESHINWTLIPLLETLSFTLVLGQLISLGRKWRLCRVGVAAEPSFTSEKNYVSWASFTYTFSDHSAQTRIAKDRIMAQYSDITSKEILATYKVGAAVFYDSGNSKKCFLFLPKNAPFVIEPVSSTAR